jgi:hypothetical protein
MKLIITTPFRTATPLNAIKPTPAEIDKGIPRSQRARMPPVRASGTPVKISKASVTVPKARNRSTKIRSNATGTTTVSRLVAL